MRSAAFFWALLLGIYILSSVQLSRGDEWIWNNATDGMWQSDRWYASGSTTLSCCPSSTDIAIINATDGTNVTFTISAVNAGTIDSLIVGSALSLSYPFVYISNISVRSIVVHNNSILVAGPGAQYFSVSESIEVLPRSRMYMYDVHVRSATETRVNMTFFQAEMLFPNFRTQTTIQNVWIDMKYATLYSHISAGANVTMQNSIWNGYSIGVRVSNGYLSFTESSALILRNSDFLIWKVGTPQQIARVFFVDCALELSSSSIGISDGALYTKNSSVRISDHLSFVIQDAGQAFFDTASNVTMMSNPIQLFTGSFIRFYTCSAHLIESSVLLNDSYFVVYDHANVALEGTALLVGQSMLWVSMQSTFNASWIMVMDTRSAFVCTDSSVTSEIFHLNGQMWAYGCRIDAVGSWLLGSYAAVYSEASNFNIAGSFLMDQYSVLFIKNHTRAELDGSISMNQANMLVLESDMMARGSIYTSNCVKPSIWDELLTNTTIYITPDTYCVLVVLSSNFSNTGDIILDQFSVVIFQDAEVQIGGLFSMGNETYIMSFRASVRLSGLLHMGTRAQVRCTGSTYTIDQGNMTIGDNAFMKTWQSRFVVEGGSFFSQNGQTHLAQSSLNVSGGDIIIDALDDPRINTVPDYYSFSLINSSALVNGGSFSGANTATVAVLLGSALTLSGGSMRLVNATSLRCESSNITVSGAGLFASNASVSAVNCTISVASGDLTLNQGASMSLGGSQLDIGGSVALMSGSKISINAESTLQLLGGGIFLDETADVVIDGNSTVLGAGSVTGRLTVISGTISHRVDSSPTNLTIGSWKQSNESRLEVTISSSYGSVPSSTIIFASNVTIAGTLSVQVNADMEERLRNGEKVVIVSSSSDIAGNFDHLDVNNENLACGIEIQNSGRSLAVLFDTTKCASGAPPPFSQQETPPSLDISPVSPPVTGTAIVGGSNTIAVAVGVTVAVVIVLAIVATVLFLKVPKLRKWITPWRNSNREQAEMGYLNDETSKPAPPSQQQQQAEPVGTSTSNWVSIKPSTKI